MPFGASEKKPSITPDFPSLQCTTWLLCHALLLLLLLTCFDAQTWRWSRCTLCVLHVRKGKAAMINMAAVLCPIMWTAVESKCLIYAVDGVCFIYAVAFVWSTYAVDCT